MKNGRGFGPAHHRQESNMAKIKMLVSLAGSDFVHEAGSIIDVTDAEALRYVDAGIAENIESAPIERATKKTAVEKAVKV